MLGKAMMVKLFAYNDQTNGRILSHAARLNEQQLTAPTEFGRGSLFDILLHAMTTEFIWRTLCQEKSIRPAQIPQKKDHDTVDRLQARWAEEQRLMQAYLASLNDEALMAVTTIERWDGTKYDFSIWHMLMQIIMHSMQHRSEAAAILTGYGQSPGDLDFIYSVST